jgi:Na+/H+ antiporter NhaD/arsenite permease-like protein
VLGHELDSFLAVAVFLLAYSIVALGRLPGFRIDRTGGAVIGAGLMIGLDLLPVEEAYAAVDADTILLLFGVMIVVANLRLAGFFRLVATKAVAHARTPIRLLAVTVLLSGVLSAFFVNDTICLVMAPLALEVSLALGWNPRPFLLAVATAANVGSAASLTGNPQNMLVGASSGIGFNRFLAVLGPPALLGLAVVFAVVAWVYRAELTQPPAPAAPRRAARVYRPLLWKSLAATAVMLGMFFAGQPAPKAAIVAAAIVLITRRIKPTKIYAEIDFGLLTLFVGLFLVVAGFARSEPAQAMYAAAAELELARPAVLSIAAAALSNLVSNVPAVLVFRPLMESVADPERAWLTLAMASTFAGNLTIVGSIANLIVVQAARPRVAIGFWEYFRVGAPITVVTMAIGVAWMTWAV